MPSPKAARKTSAPAVAKNPDLATKLGKRKSQEFKDKIKGWNQGGAGVVQQDDEVVVVVEDDRRDPEGGTATPEAPVEEHGAVVVVEEPVKGNDSGEERATPTRATPTRPKTPGTGNNKGTPQRKGSREVNVDRKAWVRRKSKPDSIEEQLKHVGAPKKRVVSDGHWRRDRVPKKEDESAEKKQEVTPKPTKISRSAPINVGLKVPVSVQEFVEDQRDRVKVTYSRSPSPLPSDGEEAEWERRALPDYESSGLKVYVKRRKRNTTSSGGRSALSSSEVSLPLDSSLDKSNTTTHITTPDSSPAKAIPLRPDTVPQERNARRSLTHNNSPADGSPRPTVELDHKPRPTSRRKTRSPAREFESTRKPLRMSQSKVRAAVERFESPPPNAATPATPKVFGNRIEAWLGGTPDPFVDENESLTPEPLKIARKSTQKTVGREDAEDAQRHASRKSSRRSRPSVDHINTMRLPKDEYSDVSSAATPTLRRSTARRFSSSPTKKHASGDSAEVLHEADSVPNLSRQATQRRKPSGPRERIVPSTGHKLSTIASRETFDVTQSLFSRNSDGEQPRGQGGLKRRLTKHSDLISVLSLSRDEGQAVRSARSIRTHRTSLKRATVEDLMNEVTADELKYQRELRTLVDGVIPVLLQCVLSGDKSARSAGLLRNTYDDEQTITQPIVDMGVALERLKSAHRRIPMHDPQDLLVWGQSTADLYESYIRAWRMGFDDVVVYLAPAEEAMAGSRGPSWSEGASKAEQSGMKHGDGERVGVAYLLKRPLVRLKQLAKAFKGINMQEPSASADNMDVRYNSLVGQARQRSNDERGRLEDEAAADIDTTRARDPRTMAGIADVVIDPTRCVRARDYFDMDFYHSNAGIYNCKIEIIMRDDAPGHGDASDLLFCDVAAEGRWLLFPPLPWHLVSARKGYDGNEVVVMIRGVASTGNEWQEIMTLQAADEQSAFEWVQMLGMEPAPPSLKRRGSFSTIATAHDHDYMMTGAIQNSRPPSPSEIDVPIGERVTSASRKWDGSEVNSVYGESVAGGLRRTKARRYRENPHSPSFSDVSRELYADYPREQPKYQPARYKTRPTSTHVRSKSDWTGGSSYTESTASARKKEYQVWLPSSDRRLSDEGSVDEDDRPPPARPNMKRRTSSVPALDLPTIPKLRKGSQPGTPLRRDPRHRRAESSPERPLTAPDSAPAKMQDRRITPPKQGGTKTQKPQAHSTSNFLGLKSKPLPSLTPAFLKRHRRSSSPLKHEYEPSTATESSDDSDISGSDDQESVTSTSSADEPFEDKRNDDQVSTIGDLRAFETFGTLKANRHSYPQQTPPASIYAPSGPSLQPSDSASQGPYRGVPQAGYQAAKTVASILCWNEAGTWDSLHPQECNIVVTPGLIEAFDLTQASTCKMPSDAPPDASPSASGLKPLVALELTPLVPLRRGTALDISIRSPPTDKSLIRTGNNVMFRSRTPEECEALYNLINRARINNPTYIALQNARPYPQSNWGEVMDRRNAERSSSGSWFGMGSRKASTYRSKGSRAVSAAATESSVGTMNTAFSALRRFSTGSKFFNLAKSTITSTMNGSRSTTSESLDSGASTPFIDPTMGTPLGMSNRKIRLYIRETASKWRDLGSARLTITLPARPSSQEPANPRITGLEKRIIIRGKTHGQTLLDETLGESCFERVARTGIAVSIWKDDEYVAQRGGVLTTKARVYMIQLSSERDAAYIFGQVGKLRY